MRNMELPITINTTRTLGEGLEPKEGLSEELYIQHLESIIIILGNELSYNLSTAEYYEIETSSGIKEFSWTTKVTNKNK